MKLIPRIIVVVAACAVIALAITTIRNLMGWPKLSSGQMFMYMLVGSLCWPMTRWLVNPSASGVASLPDRNG